MTAVRGCLGPIGILMNSIGSIGSLTTSLTPRRIDDDSQPESPETDPSSCKDVAGNRSTPEVAGRLVARKLADLKDAVKAQPLGDERRFESSYCLGPLLCHLRTSARYLGRLSLWSRLVSVGTPFRTFPRLFL